MQKKLIAVAVAGALAAPAVALAQSTVQIYGAVYMEYGFTDQGASNVAPFNDPADADVLQAPGSNIGFKGEEKLGGGMSAWFQCESSADFRGVNGDGFCTRNSAVGLKGGFGNAFVGIWDTPYKRARVGNVGARDTGHYGTGHLLYGSSTSTTDGGNPGVHSRRQRNSFNYDTPSFGGFTGMFSISSTNASTALTSNAANAKERTMSLAGVYRSGPLAIGVGYNENSKAYAAGAFAGDEDSFHISAAYTFKVGSGSLKLGGVWVTADADTAAAANAEVDAFHLGAEWKVSGPHNVHFGYTDVGDMEGTVGAAMGTRPLVSAAGGTGADMWQIRYQHDLSKRTWAGVGYVQLKNDSNGNYNLGPLSQRSVGAKNSAIVFNINHRF